MLKNLKNKHPWGISEAIIDGYAPGIEDAIDMSPKCWPKYQIGDAISFLCDINDLPGERIDTKEIKHEI